MKQTMNILKSQNDKLKYKYIQLPNKLKCMLIEDDKTKKSSAVMNVCVGSMQNPKETAGLAHFLEHMLFMGKYFYDFQ
jgi:secreted Zn-dependent insulinase-like peptidase